MSTAAGSFSSFLDAAVEIAGSDAASVQVVDEERSGLRLVAWRGFHPASAAFWELVVPESASTCGMALVTGERVVVSDLEAEAALADSDDLHEYRRSHLRSVQSTPLVADDGFVVGMISTHWRRPREPRDAELRRIDSLARKCAAAVAGDRGRSADEQSARTVLLHEVNQRIREMAGRFDSVAADVPQEYLCECGCGTWVALTGSEFDATVAAQQPVTGQGHLMARARTARQFSRALRDDAAALRAEALQKRRKSDELARRQQRPPRE